MDDYHAPELISGQLNVMKTYLKARYRLSDLLRAERNDRLTSKLKRCIENGASDKDDLEEDSYKILMHFYSFCMGSFFQAGKREESKREHQNGGNRARQRELRQYCRALPFFVHRLRSCRPKPKPDKKGDVRHVSAMVTNSLSSDVETNPGSWAGRGCKGRY